MPEPKVTMNKLLNESTSSTEVRKVHCKLTLDASQAMADCCGWAQRCDQMEGQPAPGAHHTTLRPGVSPMPLPGAKAFSHLKPRKRLSQGAGKTLERRSQSRGGGMSRHLFKTTAGRCRTLGVLVSFHHGARICGGLLSTH